MQCAMAVQLGTSIGAFIMLGELAFKVGRSLQDSGSCADYRCLIGSLSSLNRCLQTTSAVFLSQSFKHGTGNDQPDNAVINGIFHEVECIRKLLENFLLSSIKYTNSLLPEHLKKRPKGEWRKLTWSLSKSSDAVRLHRDLQSHLQALQLYAFTFCCQSTKDTLDGVVVENEKTQAKILEMFDLVKTISQSLPKQFGYTWEGGWTDCERPIRFQDALGRNVILPLFFCSDQEIFHDILQIMFRRMPGQRLVEHKEYELQDASGVSIIEESDWKSKMTPGALITMSMLMKLPPSRKRVHSCPRCGETNIQAANAQGLILWILVKKKVIELPERPLRPRIVKRKLVQPLHQDLTSDGPSKADRPSLHSRRSSLKEEGVFRRISYVHQTLISKAAETSPDIPKPNDTMPLHEAAFSGNITAVQEMLRSGHSINAEDEYYGSVLQAACSTLDTDCTELVRYLLKSELRLDVNLKGGNYCTALQAAAAAGNEAVVELLLRFGADENIQGGEYGTALHAAARNASTGIVRLLLEYGARVGTTHPHWGDALQTAAATAYSNSAEVLQVLLDYGADVNTEGGFYGTALQAAAAYYGHTDSEDAVKLLLENGADVNVLGGEYGSPLHVAAYKGKPPLAELLLSYGADVDVQDHHWGTPLQAAAATVYSGGEEVARMLIQYGADVNALGGEHGSVLHAAAFKGKVDLVSCLLENGAIADLELEDGSTALHIAARNGQFGVAKLLAN